MAIILRGFSTCPICRNILQDGEDVIGFAAFINNANDGLYLFNDAGLHKTCVLQHASGARAIAFADRCHEHFMLKKCWHSGEVITDYKVFYFLPLLTSDENEPLFAYNFLTLNKNNIPLWEDREHFIKTAEKFIAEGKWKDPTEGYSFWKRVINDMN